MHKFYYFLICICLCWEYSLYSTISDNSYITVNSPNSTIQDISSILQPIIDKYGVPGMSAVILNGDRIIAAGAAGVRSRYSNKKITIRDSFHIGSNTKSMTATLIAILVEKGLLNWDSRVTDVFPELKGKTDPGYENLTLEQLLTHRAGMPKDLDYDKVEKSTNNNLFQARQAVMEQTLKKPPAVDPGQFLYSNIGYIIAGHMAEKVTGKLWEDLISTMLFMPLKMTSAGFGSPGDLQTLAQPVGHGEKGNPTDVDNPPLIGPAGTIHVSMPDWSKYVMMHLNGAKGKPQLLQLSSFQKLHQPIKNASPSYAMGWVVDESQWAQGKVLAHAGSNTYWYAKVWIAPNRNLAILVACNDGSSQAQVACNQAGIALMQSQLHLPEVTSLDSPK